MSLCAHHQVWTKDGENEEDNQKRFVFSSCTYKKTYHDKYHAYWAFLGALQPPLSTISNLPEEANQAPGQLRSKQASQLTNQPTDQLTKPTGSSSS